MVTTTGSGRAARSRPRQKYQRVYWTLGNLLLFGGFYLLLYVGGIYADVEYHRMAARGDSDIEAPRMVMGELESTPDLIRAAPAARPAAPASATATEVPAGLPAFDSSVMAAEGQISAEPPTAAAPAHVSTVERIILPSIKVDSKVIEVGWEVIEQNGQQVAVWQVAEFAVGQHHGSANPGEGGNIVLAGHVGGYGKVFRDLYYVLPGDPVVLYSEGREYEYIVDQRLIVDEEGVPPAQKAANASLIAPTDHEVVTLITCWPLTGPKKFSQRVIIRAIPVAGSSPASEDGLPETVK